MGKIRTADTAYSAVSIGLLYYKGLTTSCPFFSLSPLRVTRKKENMNYLAKSGATSAAIFKR